MNRLKRNCKCYCIITAVIALFCIVYTILGRGVFSPSMTFAWAYPCVLGLGWNFALLFIQRNIRFTGTVGYRLYVNAYNTGVAFLTVSSALDGIMYIAGTSSPYIAWMRWFGWIMLGIGLLLFVVLIAQASQDRAHRVPRRH